MGYLWHIPQKRYTIIKKTDPYFRISDQSKYTLSKNSNFSESIEDRRLANHLNFSQINVELENIRILCLCVWMSVLLLKKAKKKNVRDNPMLGSTKKHGME